MAKRLQHRGGTTSQHSTFTGAVREVTVDTDKNTLVVHDGATAGGHPLATATNFTSTGIDDNATSTAITIDSSEKVGIGTSSLTQALNVKGVISIRNGSDVGTLQLGEIGGTFRFQNQLANPLPLTFWINDSERMRIDSSGNVGIGTTSPSEKLDVNGNINITGDLTVDTNTLFVDASANTVRIGNTSSTNSLIANNHELVVGNESSGSSGIAIIAPNNENSYVSFFDPDNSGLFRGSINYNHASDFLRTYVNGSERMRITSTGSVGINTTSPDAKLEVRDDTNQNTTISASSQFQTAGNYHDFAVASNNAHYAVGIRRQVTQSSPNSLEPRMDFFVQNTNTYLPADRGVKMTLLNNGRLGIGTASPSQALDVVGSIEVSDGIYIGGTGTANKLDDYEEGTWTPTWTVDSGSIASVGAKGKYLKIGKRVFIWGDMKHSSNASASGAVGMTGLPFAATEPVGHSNNRYGTIELSDQGLWTGTPPSIGRIYSSTAIALYVQTVPTSIGTQLDFSAFWTGANYSQFTFYGAYTAT
jgi:hypothetical protein